MKGQVRGLALELLMTSPCINICDLNDNDICQGCFRSSDEIAQWGSLDNEARKAILEKSKDRQLTLNVFKTD